MSAITVELRVPNSSTIGVILFEFINNKFTGLELYSIYTLKGVARSELGEKLYDDEPKGNKKGIRRTARMHIVDANSFVYLINLTVKEPLDSMTTK